MNKNIFLVNKSKKIAKIMLSMILVFSFCLTYFPISSEESAANTENEVVQESDDTASNSQEDANRASDGETTIGVDGTEQLLKTYIVEKGETLNVVGNTEGATLVSNNAKGAFIVKEGGTLNISNVTVSYRKAIESAGTVNVKGKTTLDANLDSIINATGGKVNIITDTGDITLNNKNTEEPAIKAADAASVTIKGTGAQYHDTPKVNLNYQASSTTKFPVVGSNIKIGSGVKVTDTSTEKYFSKTSALERLAFATNHIEDGAYLWDLQTSDGFWVCNDDDKRAFIDDVGVFGEVIANHYLAKADYLIPAAIEYSETNKNEVVVDLVHNATSTKTYHVEAGANLTLNMGGFTLTSTDKEKNGGSVFYVEGGTLSVNGKGKLTGERTGIYLHPDFDTSVLNINTKETPVETVDQELTISGTEFHAIHAKNGSLNIAKGTFNGKLESLLVDRKVNLNITGGDFKEEVKALVADGYTTKNESNRYVVIKDDNTGNANIVKTWWNPNGTTETNPLYVYNRGLATTTNNNAKTWEVNGGKSAAGVGNLLATTFETNKGLTYQFQFDLTNRLSVSKDENTVEVYVYPGKVDGNFTNDMLTKAVKLGEYYGNDNAWMTINGEFKATSPDTTFFFKTKKSSGLGGVIKIDSIKISRDMYNLTEVNANNTIQNGDFNGLAKWGKLNTKSKVETGPSTTYTNAPKSKGYVAEVNSANVTEINTLNQTFNTTVEGKLRVSFDFVKRVHDQKEINNIFEVYVVDAKDVTGTSNLGDMKADATLIGNGTHWQTASFYCDVPKNQDETMIIFKALTPSGIGIIIDNVQIDDLSWTPVLEGVTDTTLTVKPVEGATSYQLLDVDNKPIGQPNTDGKFDGLKPGTKYNVAVTKGNETKNVEGVTTKKVFTGKTKAIEVVYAGVQAIEIKADATQEYTIDNGANWISSDDGYIVFEKCNPITAYTLKTRVKETFDTMYGSEVSKSVTTIKVVAPQITKRADTSVIVEGIENQEYSIDGQKTWKNPVNGKVEFTQLTQKQSYKIVTRVKAKEHVAASPTKEATFVTKQTSPEAEAIIPVIVEVGPNGFAFAVTPGQEYSLDGSKWMRNDSSDIRVISGKNELTEYKVYTRIKETDDVMPSAMVSTTLKTIEVVKPVITDRSDKEVTLTAKENQEYSIDGKTWMNAKDGKVIFTDLEDNTQYTVQTRVKAKTYIAASKTKDVKFTTKKSSPDEQAIIPVVLEVGVNGIVVEVEVGQEYSIDGGKSWTTSEEDYLVFNGLLGEDTYVITTRMMESETAMAGGEEAIEVDTIGILTPVVVERTASKVVISAVENQEYSIDDGETWVNAKDGKVTFATLQENTNYRILTRVKAQTYLPESAVKHILFKTKITITGVVTGEDLPATVTIIDPRTGNIIAVVTTDEKGNWKIDLDEGDYKVKFVGGRKKESGETTIKVTGEGSEVVTHKMKKHDSVGTSDTTNVLLLTSILLVGAGVAMNKRKQLKEMK